MDHMRNWFVIVICAIVNLWTGSAALAASVLDVYVVGSCHRMHLDPSWGFSLGDLRATVAALHPDLLCLEIYPCDHDTALVGLYPPETVVLEDLAKTLSISSVCVDWRANIKDYKPYSKATIQLLEPLQKKLLSLLEQFKGTKYKYYTSAAGQRMSRQAHDTIFQQDGEAADGFWIARNTKIVENCLREAHQKKAQRIVLVFGMDHKYILEDCLSHHRDVRVRSVPIIKDSSNWRPTPVVVNTWKKRLASLQALRSSHDTHPSVIEKIDDSKRIEELSIFIRSGGN